MERIRRISRILRIVFLVIIVLTPIINALIWYNFERLNLAELSRVFPSLPLDGITIHTPLPADVRALGFLVAMIPAGIQMTAFYLLFRLFGLYAQGEIFTEGAVGYIRKTGYTLLAAQIIRPLQDALLTLVLTMHNAPGMRTISVGIGSTDLAEILIACLVILVSWIMDEGRKLKEEEALVI